ncbi:MAG: 2-oxoacid:acceptor oxidoreductase subunit alpha [Planctomycetota bacterium]|jgi:2-oxoglutarate ferredoxin oxidoreductase subunit alpha
MSTATRERRDLERAVILFSGDSGDGMQLTGTQFTTTSAKLGNDVCTLPDYPSEIRAPKGSIAGVSAFQLNISSRKIQTPGDRPDALVAMNPAALKVHLPRLEPGGVLVVNVDAFTDVALRKAGYEEDPLEDPDLAARYQLHTVPITSQTLAALEGTHIEKRQKERCKNFFTLGLLYWLYDRPIESSREWIDRKFAGAPRIAEANRLALEAGYEYGEGSDRFGVQYRVPPAPKAAGDYRIVNGNEAFALGSVTAARLANKPLIYSSYPITPASDVLHHLARLKHFDVRTIQAEDEIAAMGSAIGAAFGGALSLTGTSGPGICLKSEAINLAIMLELPLVIINVQRGGPSTGLPTKTEQSDLLQAMVGRNGDSPIPVLAASSASDCFDVAVEAFRIAVRHTTPVIVLSESYVANGAELWRIPSFEALDPIPVEHPVDAEGFHPYSRDDSTLARPWAVPGTPGLEHRLGGLEKQHETGGVSHDPYNHERMSRMRAEKVARIAEFVPEQSVEGPDEADLLVISWGGTHGMVSAAVANCRDRGRSVAHAHLRYLNPFPRNLGRLVGRYSRVLVPELNGGQLALMLRARFLIDVISFSKIQGRPFTVAEVEGKVEEVLS